MTHQSEYQLEEQLLTQLKNMGYEYVELRNEEDLLTNLKKQLEKHNKTTFSDNEFKQVLNHLNSGNVFERAHTLRDKLNINRDDGTSDHIEFLQKEHWCQNQYQVTHQITMEGAYKNRYDVTLLINGLPLVQIELKRRGLELKEAFNQINRYHRHSFGASYALFQFVQIFVISNGVNTKYYANNRNFTFKQTFYWADKENTIITQLGAFTEAFLERCHISKMIAKYTVLNETQKILMVLRPYQYYATEAIVERVKNTEKNGYIWHTTGSGKTLTSFKASQVLMHLPDISKVVFVVDRKDLDHQTTKEFDSFKKGSVAPTDNTSGLVRQFEDVNTKLIVTTIQKLNNAIQKNRFTKRMEELSDKKIVFIFDECHRSQFGETHKRIKQFFTRAQMFGFTGTPIFADNAAKNELGKRTTADLFDECLHKYVITDAINDGNVLKFSVEYIGRYRERTGSKNEIDIEVEAIDSKELMESPKRIEKIVDYILENHARKTHNKDFTAILCVSNIPTLIKYYELFKKKKEEGKHDLKIATIFSYTANEDDADANGIIPEDIPLAAEPNIPYGVNAHTRDKLEAFIKDYNQMFGSDFSTRDSQSFYNYNNDISKMVKNREIDILLVVNMFLTGFDSVHLNTLYVDKNLRYHGLIQAYSRTNRILDEQKSQGNIVCFRNLKKATDEAITLFSNEDAKETIFLEPYETYVERFNEAYEKLLAIASTPDAVNQLEDEDAEAEFVKAFRDVLRLKNILVTFADFSFEEEEIEIDEQEFEDYKSKYLDLYDKVKQNTEREKVSILDDVDFELELIHRDEINVAYILELLAKLKDTTGEEHEQQKKRINDLLNSDTTLRSKRELIQEFIENNLPFIQDTDLIGYEFDTFWSKQEEKAITEICKEEELSPEKLRKVISDYIYTDREPLKDEISTIFDLKLGILQKETVTSRIITKIKAFVETFKTGMT